MRKILTTVASVALVLGVSLPMVASAEGEKVPIETLKPAVHLEKPTLQQTGGKLIMSDSPETYNKNDGAFYRDTGTGEFRVFWHHQNRSGITKTVAVALTNTSDVSVEVFSEGVGLDADYYPDVAGEQALTTFLKNKSEKQYLVTLAPGESYFIEKQANDLDTVSGFAQFNVYQKYGHEPGTVTVTTLNYVNKPSDPLKVEILPADTHTRGSFAHFNREGTITYNTSLGNALIRLSSAEHGQWTDKLPGEYEDGVDVVDGNKTVINNGNYGVIYDINLRIDNGLGLPREVDLFDNPSGGGGHYVMSWNGHISNSGYLNYLKAWDFASPEVGANSNSYHLVTSLPGGAAGPQVIYFKTK